MRLILTLIAIVTLSGCAASISPVPGIEVGFEANPKNVGGTLNVDTKAAGCEGAKAISWNWLENQLCDEKVAAE